MFKAIFGVGTISIIAVYYISKYAREQLKRGENPIHF